MAAYRLQGEGIDSHWTLYWKKEGRKDLEWANAWRRGKGFEAYLDEDGQPQRYGAFLLTDHLSAPETSWVTMPFDGQEMAFDGQEMEFSFDADGIVKTSLNGKTKYGTWWLEAGKLVVSVTEYGIQSWPWREAAAHVGFEAPQRSLTPWRQ